MEVTILNTDTKKEFQRKNVESCHAHGKYIVLGYKDSDQQTFQNKTHGGKFTVTQIESDSIANGSDKNIKPSLCFTCNWNVEDKDKNKKCLHNITDDDGKTIKYLCNICYKDWKTAFPEEQTKLTETRGIVLQYWDGSDQVFETFNGKGAEESANTLIRNLINAGYKEVRVKNHVQNISISSWKNQKDKIDSDK